MVHTHKSKIEPVVIEFQRNSGCPLPARTIHLIVDGLVCDYIIMLYHSINAYTRQCIDECTTLWGKFPGATILYRRPYNG